MDKRRIAVFVGSLRPGSFNRQLARALERLGGDRLEFDPVDIGRLPFYDQDFDSDYPVVGVELKRQVRAADAVLFVTPEYNRSIPGVLKNAIDQASRPWGQSQWAGKPAAVAGVSIGAIGTAVAQAHLRSVLSFLAMPELGQPELYIQWKDGLVEQGQIGAASRELVQKFVDAFVAWVRQHPGRSG